MYPVSVTQLILIGSIVFAALLFGFALKKEITEYRKKKKQAEADSLRRIDGRVLLWFLDHPTKEATSDFLAAELVLTLSEVSDSFKRLEVKQKVASSGEYWRLRRERDGRREVA